MARRYWPGSDPVGRTLRLKEDQRWMTVAGVVADIKHMGLKADEGPVVYIPYAQKTQDWLAWTTLLVRTAGEPMDFVPSVRNAIRSIDKNQPVAEIGTLEESLARSTAMPRFTTFVIGAVSGFALLIAVVGVYGLLAYTVAQRMPELGIRSALGASPLQLSWLLLRQRWCACSPASPADSSAPGGWRDGWRACSSACARTTRRPSLVSRACWSWSRLPQCWFQPAVR